MPEPTRKMTSGNVPLEKTIKRQVCTRRLAETRRKSQLTQYLATSTIANNNKFPTNFSHDVKELVYVFRRDKDAVQWL